MKSIRQIIRQAPVFLNSFSSQQNVFDAFEVKETEGIKILFASYGGEDYTGDAWVLFCKDSKLYEASGSHCSCYGLEDRWSPEDVDLKELENRLLKGTFGSSYDHKFNIELMEFLGIDSSNSK